MNINKSLLLIFALLSLTFISCKKDFEEEDGDVRDGFIGTWTSVAVGSQTGTRTYDVNIVKDESFSSRVNIFNGYNLGVNDSIYANISSISSSTITIPSQTLLGNFFKGNGKQENSQEIIITYTADDGTDIDSVTATWTR